jgi:uncharacterized membrane protein
MVRAPRPIAPGTLQPAWLLGHDRTTEHDAGFAIQQLVEVALHALSPAINEPFTAMTCIDRLGEGFAALASRAIPDPARVDRDGRLRVVAPARTFAALLREAFGPLRRAAASQPIVAERLLHTLGEVGSRVRRPADATAVGAELEAACAAALAVAGESVEREELLAAAARATSRIPSFE